MRLIRFTSALLLTLLSTTTVLGDTLPAPTSSTNPDDYRAEATPFPSHLEVRQNLGQLPDATLAGGQVPPVTVYTIATQVGATGVQTVIQYTQLFVSVPDQWPAAKAGTIGYGSIKQKRTVEVEARATEMEMEERVMEVEQPVVMVQETEIVTVPVQKVVEVLVFEGVVVSNTTAINNGTRPAEVRSGNAPAFLGTAAFRPMFTAAAAASGVVRPSGG